MRCIADSHPVPERQGGAALGGDGSDAARNLTQADLQGAWQRCGPGQSLKQHDHATVLLHTKQAETKYKKPFGFKLKGSTWHGHSCVMLVRTQQDAWMALLQHVYL